MYTYIYIYIYEYICIYIYIHIYIYVMRRACRFIVFILIACTVMDRDAPVS